MHHDRATAAGRRLGTERNPAGRTAQTLAHLVLILVLRRLVIGRILNIVLRAVACVSLRRHVCAHAIYAHAHCRMCVRACVRVRPSVRELAAASAAHLGLLQVPGSVFVVSDTVLHTYRCVCAGG